MRINYTMYGTMVNGGVRVIFEIAQGLAERGHELSITAIGKRGDANWFPFSGRLTYSPDINRDIFFRFLRKVLYPRLRPPGIVYDLNNRQLLSLIPDADINVATYGWTAFPVYEASKGKLFYHMQHHEVLFYQDPELQHKMAETYYLPLKKIANCLWLKHQIEETYGAENLPLVNPAIDHKYFYPHKVSKDTSKVRIVSLARNEEWKGMPVLLESMRRVMKKHRSVEWYVYGVQEPPFKHVEAPYTFIHSPVNHELAELYSSADIVVNPSWYESFPLPPLEAMACGAAVVTTQYGTEDYARHRDTALVVPPKDGAAMTEAIELLLGDSALRRELVDRGLEESKKFTWKHSVDAAEKIFLSAV